MALHAAESPKLESAAQHLLPLPYASAVAGFDCSKGGVSEMTLSDYLAYARANWKKEEGQTMAEYGVVLAVITVGIVIALTALSDGIQGALSAVVGRM